MQNWKRYTVFVALTGCIVFFFSSCVGGLRIPVENEPPLIRDGSPVWGGVDGVVNLAQGWSREVQDYWYFTSQGTQIIQYDWFLHLEQATNQTRFRSNDNMTRLRYLPQGVTPQNPDALPVGFVKDVNDAVFEEPPGEWFGINCSACHTAQIEFDGQAIRIEGGPALADFNVFFEELVESLEATLSNQAKFDRFANNVLGANAPSGSVTDLRDRLTTRTAYLRSRLDINKPPFPAGYARLDAVGNIFNAVWGQDLTGPPPNDVNKPPNTAPANAPVSYPALWDAPHTDLVQWAGFVKNKPPGPVTRNLGEVLGVFATFHYEEDSPDGGYQSSARITKQSWLEVWLQSLWSPLWPDEFLPAIDTTMKKQGEALYTTYCLNCHAILEDRTDPNREIAAQMWSLPLIGTDTLNAANFVNRSSGMIRTGKIEGKSAYYVAGPPLGPDVEGGDILVNAEAGILIRKPAAALESVVDGILIALPKAPKFDPKSYRARTLNGVWATAPYLHNGSVPNLWELLKPSMDRVKTFNVGSREFDPVNVGYVTTVPSDGHATLLDTSEPGNSNAGHDYGGAMSDAEKRALIEYIKSL